MSGEGGDGGGGDKGGGGGGGDMYGDSGANYGTPTNYSPPDYSSPTSSYTSPAEQSGFQGSGALPPEISTGSSSGVGNGLGNPDSGAWGAPSINDFVSGPTGGFNLADPGPVGGISPAAGGGVFSSGGDTSTPFSSDSNALGTTASATGSGSGASAFAAPSGVSGTTDLSALVADPNANGSTGGGSTDTGIFDSLNGAQSAAANDYGIANAGAVPSADSTLPATTSSTSSGAGSGNSSGILGTGISSNNLGLATAGAGLLNNLINGKSGTASTGALNAQANTANANAAELLARGKTQGDTYGTPALQSGQEQTAKGAALQQYVATGTLPQGYEDQIQQAAQSAKSQIISNYANRGLPTDPSKNSSLAQELAQVDARLPAAREQLAASLATTGNSIVASGNATSQTGNALTSNQLITDGLQSSGISSQIYQTLANLENDQNKQRGAAIANFAAALNGGSKGGVNINLGKAA